MNGLDRYALGLMRLAGSVWIIGAGFLVVVTAVFLPVAILTLPWATAMFIVGRPLLRARWSTSRTTSSMLLAVGSLVLIATFPDQDVAAYVVAPGISGFASTIALAIHGLGGAQLRRSST